MGGKGGAPLRPLDPRLSKAIFRARTYDCITYSVQNETRRKPATGRQPPSLFDKWHGIFYMPSRTNTVVYPVIVVTAQVGIFVPRKMLKVKCRAIFIKSPRGGIWDFGPFLKQILDLFNKRCKIVDLSLWCVIQRSRYCTKHSKLWTFFYAAWLRGSAF